MSKLAPSNATFCYDGSLEGFLSAVFDAYAYHCHPACICPGGAVQLGLSQALVDVATDLAHAERVRVGICSHAGVAAYRKVKTGFLSDEEGREDALFSYIVAAMEQGHRVHGNLVLPCVAAVERLAGAVLNERERMYQFLRFEELEGGVFFARINPNANVVPLMMGHFAERFSSRPFVIYDEVHGLAGVCCEGECTMVVTDQLTVPDRSADEAAFQALWKRFYDAVSNEQRYNPDLRRSLVPKRLWRNMTEFKLAV